jgi:excinuclease ABC subunit C
MPDCRSGPAQHFMQVSAYSPADVKNFPDKPGVYRFYNKEGGLIYVGKAKNLKARASNYFNDPGGHNRKTRKMVSEVQKIEFTLVNTEFDALLLENNLIKSSQPKYNILLKDDKTFPYVLIVDEHFPRIYATRQMKPGKGKYFGPFSSVRAMKSVLELIRNLYHIRTCNLNLAPEIIAKGKYKVCLEYHIGRCKGPCAGLQAEGDYLADISLADHILKGNLAPVRQYFKQQMQEAAEGMAFERAQEMKDKLDLLEKFQARTVIVNPSIADVDAFGIVTDDNRAYVNYLKIANGSIVLSKTVEVKKKLEESDEDILTQVAFDLRDRFGSASKEVLSNLPLTFDLHAEARVPKIGDKKKLVDLAVKNALYYKKERLVQAQPEGYRQIRVLQQLQEDLQLKELPEHIECFDNSNIQGTNPVASMVSFKKGKPSKSDYRKYNIKTVTGPDDFGSMREIVYRRYRRLLDENEPLPNLIVIDGGKGQLNAAVAALEELGIYGRLAIVGIAKRLEEIYFPHDQFPLHIHKKSESLKLLQHIRNEAHRFAITFHRQKRSKSALGTSLTQVEGIGEKTAEKLLQQFKSVKKLREASLDDIAASIGMAKAKELKKHLQ